MKTMLPSLTLILTIVFAASAHRLYATPSLYDGFSDVDYTHGEIIGQNGGFGHLEWSAGPWWYDALTPGGIANTSVGLSTPRIQGIGGALYLWVFRGICGWS